MHEMSEDTESRLQLRLRSIRSCDVLESLCELEGLFVEARLVEVLR